MFTPRKAALALALLAACATQATNASTGWSDVSCQRNGTTPDHRFCSVINVGKSTFDVTAHPVLAAG